jgi:hypothetical protein
MEPLTDQQWAQLLGACQRSAWHLETRDWYGVDDEKQPSVQYRLAMLPCQSARDRHAAPLGAMDSVVSRRSIVALSKVNCSWSWP